ncbi:GNAT family N-acetyltransferase [Mycobacteroides abscessus]|uniref:GNAT family N-acetyltransferase n=1 Tax=Mycobacteroides abscessus TaxID=36809 RepID=UPI000925B82E|nr:GNAT family N-acetyltransferase [Mycobacteroides abscessus]QSM04899.1 acetyltransferase [Mycobacterium phage prophi91-4]MDO3335145.1 GNAT family N-acetyltransferase [Mycobacteroides abscessus subsp. bolletii]QSM87819.1 GNAT family N-acetyltransferase [Mycobacteroides abscessus subsp. bolletii]SIB01496.1 GCN5-related N-acetyltransferase [Mycobacteroides abscessus subsp. bolletii]SII69563.1 GCN5-related N-acetyltransferase [Mycobacteroides abscessus subsp. bolletii]
MPFSIALADFKNPALLAFLQTHLDDIAPTGPADSQHALDAERLQAPGVRLWAAHSARAVVGTVALSHMSATHEELKSMRTAPAQRGRGIASALLLHALADARQRSITRISLETGSMDFFAPARAFYLKHGFTECGPFGTYTEDSNSIFLTLQL